MALPFFRKNKDKPAAAAASTRAEAAATAQETLTRLGADFGLDSRGIVVEEGSGAPQSALDEAAIQFASGQYGHAENTLKSLVADKTAATDKRAWAMLFDLYCALGQESEFEHLALDFAVRFESSPPVWRARALAQAQTDGDGELHFDLSGLLSRANVDVLAASLANAPDAPLTLDFSGVEMVDEGGAEATVRQLDTLRKRGRKLRLVGVERLLPLLADLTRATQSKPAHWLLLLALHQLQGDADAFENLAVDYAVRFEVSPPSWETAAPVEMLRAGSVAPAAAAARSSAGLSGEITPENDGALRTLVDHAAVGEVRIDLGQVTRIDYGSVSQLIGVLMDGLGQGKSVTFVDHSALIHELFRVMGIDQLASLEPRRSL